MQASATGEKSTMSSLLLYTSPNVIRVIKARRSRLVGHVARVEKRRSACRALVGTPEKNTWKTSIWIGGYS